MKEIDWQGNERWAEPQIKDHSTWWLGKKRGEGGLERMG
jgi:hypothetical protein